MNPPSNTFLATLQKHRSGGLLNEASAKLAEVTAAVHATGKKGSITIQLNVVPADAGVSCITLHDDVKVKIPKTPTPRSLWYTTPEGELLKDNPAQEEIRPIVMAAESQTRPVQAITAVAPIAVAVNA